jgi:hypothetical protein
MRIINNENNEPFEIDENPFDFIDIDLTSLQIEGVNWDELQIDRNYKGRHLFVKKSIIFFDFKKLATIVSVDRSKRITSNQP